MDGFVESLVIWMQDERFSALQESDQARVRLATETIVLLRRRLRHAQARLSLIRATS